MTPITLERRDGVATITLDRPEAANAVDMAFAEGLVSTATSVGADDTVRAVLLRANGRHFCVGGDLKSFAALGLGIEPALKTLADRLHEGVLLLTHLPVPLVVAVQGNAAGAGMSLALLGDICLAASTARFRVAYTAVGLTADGGGSWMLPRLVGPRIASELTLTNRILHADEAHRLGIVNRVVAEEDLDARARELVAELAAGPTGAFRAAKRLLADSAEATLAAHLDAEAFSISTRATTPEGQEGISAFVEKRAPKYP